MKHLKLFKILTSALSFTTLSAGAVIAMAACGDECNGGGGNNPEVVQGTLRYFRLGWDKIIKNNDTIYDSFFWSDGHREPQINPYSITFFYCPDGYNEPFVWNYESISILWDLKTQPGIYDNSFFSDNQTINFKIYDFSYSESTKEKTSLPIHITYTVLDTHFKNNYKQFIFNINYIITVYSDPNPPHK